MSVASIKITDETTVRVVRVPVGPKGDPGASASTIEVVQSSPEAGWIVNHNLGRKPTVSVLTVGGVVFDAETVHTTSNQFRVLLASAMAGRVVYF